jgi:hypothetical protein
LTETYSLEPNSELTMRMPSPETVASTPVTSLKVLIAAAMSERAVPELKLSSREPRSRRLR